MKHESRGKGLLRQEWFSVCSQHRAPVEDCARCEQGEWKYIAWLEIEHGLFKLSPRLWKAWANRPYLNPSRRFLESVFPRLRKKR